MIGDSPLRKINMQTHLYIQGAWRTGRGKSFHSFNSATGKRVWQGRSAGATDVGLAVKAARAAYLSWSATPIETRKELLNRFAAELTAQQNEFAGFISQETGKPYWESLTEVTAMVNKIAISFRAYEERCHETLGTMGDARRATRFRPYGVVAVLGPFNLPGHLPQGHIVPALLAGNTVVFKPSELTPAVGQRLAEIWEKVGVPPGVFNLIQGGRETGAALLRQPDLDGLYFTGSAPTGKLIHEHFAGHPEKILALEMGGNNPLVVFDIKDAKAAAYMTIQSAFITAGQRCVCARRLIVENSSSGRAFVDQLVALTQKVRVGPYTDHPEPFMGPVISKKAAERVLKAQEKLHKSGGKVLLKSVAMPKQPSLLTPGIIDVTSVKNRPDDEIFGPFLQVIRVKNFDEAIAEANNTVYGLAAGLLSDNGGLYKKFLQQSRAGIVNWNRQITGASSEAPFGGVGQSGNNRPSAYFAADYCAYPVASLEFDKLALPEKLTPGISF